MNTWERGDTDGLQIPPIQGSNLCEDRISFYRNKYVKSKSLKVKRNLYKGS